MNNIDYKKIKAWPFQEAIKLKNKVSKIPNKKVVTLETGYGPSGDPHIGTFAEVLRTNMVLNCCLLYTSPSPRDRSLSRMPSSA